MQGAERGKSREQGIESWVGGIQRTGSMLARGAKTEDPKRETAQGGDWTPETTIAHHGLRQGWTGETTSEWMCLEQGIESWVEGIEREADVTILSFLVCSATFHRWLNTTSLRIRTLTMALM